MNHEAGLKKLRIDDSRVKKRAKKLVRRLNDVRLHLPCEAAREMACVYLAARVEGSAMDAATSAACARWGGCREDDFLRTATFIQNGLSLKFASSLSLNLLHLCGKVAEAANFAVSASFLEEETRLTLALFVERRPQSSLSDIHTAAAFVLVCQRDAPKHITVTNEKELAAKVSVDPRRLRDVMVLIKEVVPEVLPEATEKEKEKEIIPKTDLKRKKPTPFVAPKVLDSDALDPSAPKRRKIGAHIPANIGREEEVADAKGVKGGKHSLTAVTAERERAEREIVYLKGVTAEKQAKTQLKLTSFFKASKEGEEEGEGEADEDINVTTDIDADDNSEDPIECSEA